MLNGSNQENIIFIGRGILFEVKIVYPVDVRPISASTLARRADFSLDLMDGSDSKSNKLLVFSIYVNS